MAACTQMGCGWALIINLVCKISVYLLCKVNAWDEHVSKGSMLDDLKNSSFPTVSSQTHPAYANLTRHRSSDNS